MSGAARIFAAVATRPPRVSPRSPDLVGVREPDESGLAIHEVSKRTGVSIHALRYYEQAGLVPAVRRAASGHREYQQVDVDWVVFVRRLRATNMPVATIRRYTQLALEGPSTVSQRLALLESHRASVNLRIDELRRNLVLLDSKIATYRKTQLERAEDMGICWPGQA